MINYKQILEDNSVIAEYQKIDLINPHPFNHGLQHVKNVVEIMKKLIVVLNINENEANNLLIAAALHDVGQVDSRDDHGKKGREFAEKYLSGKINPADLETILTAIEFHSQKTELDQLSLNTILLCFADKMDFTRNRLEKDCEEKFGDVVYSHVESVDFELSEEEFKVKIATDTTITATDFLNSKGFFFKSINVTKELANKLGVSGNIYVDNVLLNADEMNDDFAIAKKTK